MIPIVILSIEHSAKTVPFLKIPNLNKIHIYHVGQNHTCCCNIYGKAFTFGHNKYGQLGNDTDLFKNTNRS